MLEFKPGDKVKIRSYEEITKTLGHNKAHIKDGLYFELAMKQYIGDSVYTIYSKDELGRSFYILEKPNDNWLWHSDWLKKVGKITLKEFLND
jgi:hypothetical protein